MLLKFSPEYFWATITSNGSH